MSRIIVKNLSQQVTDEKLRQTFGDKGLITDVQRKFTKEGKFRGFAFVGFKTENEAKEAQKYFDNSFIGPTKVKVEICCDLGDESKPKSRSKHTQVKIKQDKEENEDEKKESKKKKSDLLEELQNDPHFNEFIEVNKKKHEKTSWANDLGKIKVENEDDESEKKEIKKEISDLDYLKSKVVAKKELENDKDNSFTVVMRNLPFKCKKKQIIQFLSPIKPVSVRLPPKIKGVAYIKLKNEKEMKNALNKKNSFLDGHKILVVKYNDKQNGKGNGGKNQNETKKWQNAEDELKNEESIAESGRLFIRNLPYTALEEDIETLVTAFGPVTEVSLPVDKFSNTGKGFAFVTFMFPQHAEKAEKELDGKIFQGRILHILRAKQKPTNEKAENEMTFKDKKINDLKLSKNNWNALFLGSNAVAEAMAEKYNITKSELLNHETSDSLAVRLALGETQLVAETRKFLEESGVHLPAFEKALNSSERSKNVILVKNLPSKTFAKELKELFSPFGSLRRIVLPPHGVTAVVEFEAPARARQAFTQLAYTKFKDLPLYLEWAPIGSLKEQTPEEIENPKEKEEKVESNVEDKSQIENSASKNRVKILVRNIPFQATKKEIEKLFSPFGLLSFVRLPLRPSSTHRGFAFVQFASAHDAQRAFSSLSGSTHLFGRRLVFEWAHQQDDNNTNTQQQQQQQQEASLHQFDRSSIKRKSAILEKGVTKSRKFDA